MLRVKLLQHFNQGDITPRIRTKAHDDYLASRRGSTTANEQWRFKLQLPFRPLDAPTSLFGLRYFALNLYSDNFSWGEVSARQDTPSNSMTTW